LCRQIRHETLWSAVLLVATLASAYPAGADEPTITIRGKEQTLRIYKIAVATR
jgi:hypothetical protein